MYASSHVEEETKKVNVISERMLSHLELCLIMIQVLTSLPVIRTAELGLLNTIMRPRASFAWFPYLQKPLARS